MLTVATLVALKACLSPHSSPASTSTPCNTLAVLYSYSRKLEGVGVWSVVKMFLSAAQHTLHYGAHYIKQGQVRGASFMLIGFNLLTQMMLPLITPRCRNALVPEPILI